MKMLDKILEIISIHLGIEVEDLSDEMALTDIGIDSLTLMKIIMSVENTFDIHIYDEEIVELRLISDIADVTVRKVSF
jgi:acyl carrier protein